MGYTVVKSFERGMDTRRLLEAVEPGSLLDAKDCHITRGGEIEKRAAFVIEGTLPATTMGFFATSDGSGPTFHTFGDALTAPAGMPTNGVYHAIPHPLGFDLVAIMKVEEFMGKIYVVAQYEGGRLLHWWGDSIDASGAATPPLMALIVEFIPVPTPAVDDEGNPIPTDPPPPTDPGAKPETTLEWNYLGTTAPRYVASLIIVSPNTGTGQITYPLWFLADNPILSTDIPVGDGTGSNIATLVAQAINSRDTTGVPVDVVCYAEGNKTRIVVNEASSFYNGWRFGYGASKIMASKVGSVAPHQWATALDMTFKGGKNPLVPPSGLRGTVYAGEDDVYPEGTPKPKSLGTFALAHNEKMYTVSEQMLNFSMIQDASLWDAGLHLGAGKIDHTAISEGHPALVSLADYGGDLAVFGTRHIFVWHTDPDPLKYGKKQVLHRTGTIAPHSVKSFGSGDVMYLDRSGIRSLRAREGFDIAYASDLGIMVDRVVREKVATLTLEEQFHNVWTEVEPNSGRLWLALKDKIFVLSYYPGERISAWTYYAAVGFQVDMMNATTETIYWRSGNNIVSYGGIHGTTYDNVEANAWLPFIDGGKPATHKNWTGIDAAVYGTWKISASFDPTQPNALDLVANITKSTYAQQKHAMNGASPSVSLEMRTSFVGPARLGNVALHYEPSTAD